MKIVYINYGIGNRVGNTIFLKKFPKLEKAIINHEKNHSSCWTFRDFVMDLYIKELKEVKKEYYKFLLTTPSSWLNFFPFIKLGGKWAFDLSLFLVWMMCLLIIFLVYLIWRVI